MSYLNFAVSSFVFAGAMAWDPPGFFAWLGVPDVTTTMGRIYAGVIFGEAVVSTAGVIRPLRALGILLFMVAYKSAVIALLLPSAWADDAPGGLFIVIGAQASAALWAAAAMPWSLWREAG